jgi:hypothetical protein
MIEFHEFHEFDITPIYYTSTRMKLQVKSEPQNIEQEISNDEVWNRCAQSFFYKIDRIHYFDIRYSLFDIRYSLFQSFYFDLTGRSAARGCAEMRIEKIHKKCAA